MTIEQQAICHTPGYISFHSARSRNAEGNNAIITIYCIFSIKQRTRFAQCYLMGSPSADDKLIRDSKSISLFDWKKCECKFERALINLKLLCSTCENHKQALIIEVLGIAWIWQRLGLFNLITRKAKCEYFLGWDFQHASHCAMFPEMINSFFVTVMTCLDLNSSSVLII